MAPSIEETGLIAPYGGELVDLVAPQERFADLKARASRLDSIQLSERAICDLELLATGAFSPLDRFMGQDDYRRSVGEMRLADGTLFPVPVTLSIEHASSVKIDADVALRDARNDLLAVMTIQEAYEWSPLELADEVFGTRDVRHPVVSEMQRWGRVNLSGPLQVLQLPRRYDFTELRRTPRATRDALIAYGRANVVAFHACDPVRQAEEELTRRAAQSVDGVLLLHPAVGSTTTARHGPLHAHPHVPDPVAALLRERSRAAIAATAGDEVRWTSRGALARDHPTQLRRQLSDRWPGPRQSPRRLGRPSALPPRRCP